MSAVAGRTAPRRSGGRRVLIVLAILVLIVAGVIVWLNIAAQASVNASATLTVYQPTASIQHGAAGTYAPASTGAVVQPGDSVQTDTKGFAAIVLPDGTVTRLATNTTITLDAAHFTKGGNLHDVKISQFVGRTFTNVQHLVSGATFQVSGKSATATVRGTKFEVLIKPDGSMTVKLFEGQLDFDGKNHVHLVAGQQATADPDGNIGSPIPIQPDPGDPFGPALAASNAVEVGTTPGTEQDFIGPPLHNGELQTYTYSYAGNGDLQASAAVSGSSIGLTIQAPDGQKYTQTDTTSSCASHAGGGGSGKCVFGVVHNAPSGIYSIIVRGISGLGTSGEAPFVAVASVESCSSADVDQNGAVHRGYTSTDLTSAVNVSGLSNLKLSIGSDSLSGAIIAGSGMYNGVSWSGSVVLSLHDGTLDVIAVGGTVFGLNVPAQQVVQQIGTAIGQDPSNVNPGFVVDRLFTCNSVMMVDGRHS